MAAAATAGGTTGPVRLAVSLVLGGLIAVTLFAGMRYLIMVNAPPPEERREAPRIDILSDRGESDLILRNLRPENPDEVKAPPPPPRIEAAPAEAPDAASVALLGELPDINPDTVGSGNIEFVVADRDVLPIVRIEPTYPLRAAERGIEGTCNMTFDVLPDGSVDESTIQASCSSSLFEREASRAVARWKYNPKIVGGEPVVQRGIRTDLVFQLADE